MANSVLEGLSNSEQLSEETLSMAEGQARFIRAFTYFYLVNLYGDVPLVMTTDYGKNAVAPKDSAAKVYEQIATDLDLALSLLEETGEYEHLERTHVNRFVVMALRARIYLYQQNWEKAEEWSSKVIDQTAIYEILEDLDQVFLKNSREAIWQISPVPVGRRQTTYTREGYFFRGINSSRVVLSNDFVAAINLEDKRLTHWVGYNASREFYFPQKYKDGSSSGNITEYSMVLRLAEQYLIRAEARAMQGNLPGAISDLDKLRNRANLELIANTLPGISQEDLLEEIME
jgi:hypothetical protein